MQTIKGPGLFIVQFVDADARLSTLEGIAAFAAECGFTALQMPTFYPKIFDLEQAAESQSYCDDMLGTLSNYGLRISCALPRSTRRGQGPNSGALPTAFWRPGSFD
jgi:sugar phosphate isomerase/epimerase